MRYYSVREDINLAAIAKLSSSAFKIFSLIYSEYQFKGDFIPLSYDDIQNKTNLSRGSVASSIKYLLECNYITRIQGVDKIYKYAILGNNIDNLLKGEKHVS